MTNETRVSPLAAPEGPTADMMAALDAAAAAPLPDPDSAAEMREMHMKMLYYEAQVRVMRVVVENMERVGGASTR